MMKIDIFSKFWFLRRSPRLPPTQLHCRCYLAGIVNIRHCFLSAHCSLSRPLRFLMPNSNRLYIKRLPSIVELGGLLYRYTILTLLLIILIKTFIYISTMLYKCAWWTQYIVDCISLEAFHFETNKTIKLFYFSSRQA